MRLQGNSNYGDQIKKFNYINKEKTYDFMLVMCRRQKLGDKNRGEKKKVEKNEYK